MNHARLTTEPIDPRQVLALVASPAHGASSLFLGTVRDTNEGRSVTGIDYSAYEAMAGAEMERIANEAMTRYPGAAVALIHRVGYLELTDISVAIAAAHARRGQALDAARYMIEELKKRVPIWKREHYVDGTSEWIDPTRARQGVGR
jgi:molybdopterin synthase catalytic subunit